MILALDSSASGGSVALVENDQTVREIFVETPRGRGGELFTALADILAEGPSLDRVVAGIGPGSYNGIRSALAGAWGISQARAIPLVGVCSLLALAEGEYCAVGDARRGQYYFARVKDGSLIEEPVLMSPEAAAERARDRRVFVPAAIEFLPWAEILMPSAARLARIGGKLAPAPGLPEPLYLKDPFITAARSSVTG